MTVCMFPGQGSQIKGMGRDVFAAFPEQVEQANDILGYDIRELCLDDPKNKLNQTSYTQPALYVVSALMYLKAVETACSPDYLMGHSLGEYVALFAASCFDFSTGLRLVKKRGELMDLAKDGAMFAVFDLDIDEMKDFLYQHQLFDIDVANHNTAKQIVISGQKIHLERAEKFFAEEFYSCTSLKVSGAFHSRYMCSAKNTFAAFIKDCEFSPPKIPVIANINARSYKPLDIKNNLINQITGTVLWFDSVSYLLDLGEVNFQQIGPGSTLFELVNKIMKEKESFCREREYG